MASVATLRSSDTRVVPLILGSSNHRKITPFYEMQNQDLRALDLKPLPVPARAEDQEETVPDNRYGNCAESDH